MITQLKRYRITWYSVQDSSETLTIYMHGNFLSDILRNAALIEAPFVVTGIEIFLDDPNLQKLQG